MRDVKISVKRNNVIGNIADLVFFLLIFFTFFDYVIDMELSWICVYPLSLFLWIYCIFFLSYNRNTFLMVLAIVAYVFIFYALFYGNIMTAATYLPMAVYLLSKKNISRILSLAVVLPIVLIVFTAWMNSYNNYEVFQNMGRNYVSIWFIYALALFNIYYEKNEKKCPLIAPVLVVGANVSALGRMGIVSSLLILGMFIFYRIFEHQNAKGTKRAFRILIAAAAVAILCVFIYINIDYILENYFSRFLKDTSVSNSTRAGIYSSYIKFCLSDAKAFFFGTDTQRFARLYSGNLHCSYLQIHSSFGIFGLLFTLIGSVRALVYLWKRKMYDSFIIFAGILFRMLTDKAAPGFPFELFLLYYILMPAFAKDKNFEHLKGANEVRPADRLHKKDPLTQAGQTAGTF